ncbi:MAG: hypothetical protein JSV80_10635, partial [Acidobacteriota bacterium]
MTLRVGLNGAGRIGRALIRLLRDDPRVELAVVNDVAGAFPWVAAARSPGFARRPCRDAPPCPCRRGH